MAAADGLTCSSGIMDHTDQKGRDGTGIRMMEEIR